jgi:hypothetical protein
VADDRDGLPFGLYVPEADDGGGVGQPTCYASLGEIAPVGNLDLSNGRAVTGALRSSGGGLSSAEDVSGAGGGIALMELPQPFSTAPPTQLGFAGVLGLLNLVGVLYIGRCAASVRDSRRSGRRLHARAHHGALGSLPCMHVLTTAPSPLPTGSLRPSVLTTAPSPLPTGSWRPSVACRRRTWAPPAR